MATNSKKKKTEVASTEEKIIAPKEEKIVAPKEENIPPKETVAPVLKPKANVGEIVYVSKNADADLEGFKLFPEYKNYTYTVEAYDARTDIYSLRRLNLLLHLKGEHIVRPEERAHDKLNRIQF